MYDERNRTGKGGEGQYVRYEREPEQNLSQQDKLLYAVAEGATQVLNQRGFGLTEEDRQFYIERWADIPDAEQRAEAVIKKIIPEYTKKQPEVIRSEIDGYERAGQVWKLMVFSYLSVSDSVSEEAAFEAAFRRGKNPITEDVRRCVQHLPDVISFIGRANLFMDQIERLNDPAKVLEYYRSFRVAAGLLYGKQFEYADQLIFLEQKVDQYKEVREDRRQQERGNIHDTDPMFGGNSNGSGRGGNRWGPGSFEDKNRSGGGNGQNERRGGAESGPSGISSGGQVKKIIRPDGGFEDNPSGLRAVVDYVRSGGFIPIVVEKGGEYLVYQAPGSKQYLEMLKANSVFAADQLNLLARGVKKRVDELSPAGSRKTPTQKFHQEMMKALHPDGSYRLPGDSQQVGSERNVRAELFKAYQEIEHRNSDQEYFGLA